MTLLNTATDLLLDLWVIADSPQMLAGKQSSYVFKVVDLLHLVIPVNNVVIVLVIAREAELAECSYLCSGDATPTITTVVS